MRTDRYIDSAETPTVSVIGTPLIPSYTHTPRIHFDTVSHQLINWPVHRLLNQTDKKLHWQRVEIFSNIVARYQHFAPVLWQVRCIGNVHSCTCVCVTWYEGGHIKLSELLVAVGESPNQPSLFEIANDMRTTLCGTLGLSLNGQLNDYKSTMRNGICEGAIHAGHALNWSRPR